MTWKTLLLRVMFNVWVQACVSWVSEMVVSNVRKLQENNSFTCKGCQPLAAPGGGNLLSLSFRLWPEQASVWLWTLLVVLLPSPWLVARSDPDAHTSGMQQGIGEYRWEQKRTWAGLWKLKEKDIGGGTSSSAQDLKDDLTFITLTPSVILTSWIDWVCTVKQELPG